MVSGKFLFSITLCLGSLFLFSCNNGSQQSKSADSTQKKAVVNTMVPGTPIHYDSSKRYIFLTWDDSPQPPGTQNCARTFREQGVKATFFSVAAHYNIDPLRKRILDSLKKAYPEFLVANHSYTHAFRDNYSFYYKNVDIDVNDILKAQQDMQIPLKIVRLPGRNTWAGNGEFRVPKTSEKVARRLDSLGYKIIGWDIEWQFIKGNIPKQSATALAKEVNDKFDIGYTNQPNTMVILAHDRMFAKQQYVDSLKTFIQLLKQDPRNVFETIDHYPIVQQK
ncbi:MAG: polysaccharide deacetylase family protein [Hydrotalea flava]|nr:polysaccharide deacetylase family protein [Hydrotalea flava]